MLTPEFISMHCLDNCDNLHVYDKPSNVHHIQVPHPPCFSFNGNIHPLHQWSYAIGDKVYFKEVIESYIFLGMMTKCIWTLNSSIRIEHEAKLLPPVIPGYPAQSIHLQLSHQMCLHEWHQFTPPHVPIWTRLLEMFRTLTGIICQQSPDFPEDDGKGGTCLTSMGGSFLCFLYMTHFFLTWLIPLSILATLFSPLLIFTPITPILTNQFSIVSPLVLCILMLCNSTDSASSAMMT